MLWIVISIWSSTIWSCMVTNSDKCQVGVLDFGSPLRLGFSFFFHCCLYYTHTKKKGKIWLWLNGNSAESNSESCQPNNKSSGCCLASFSSCPSFFFTIFFFQFVLFLPHWCWLLRKWGKSQFCERFIQTWSGARIFGWRRGLKTEKNVTRTHTHTLIPKQCDWGT